MRTPLLSPQFLKRFAGSRAWFWFLTMVVAVPLYALGVIDLTKMAFGILEVSLYANMESAWTNYQAARTEERQVADTALDEKAAAG